MARFLFVVPPFAGHINPSIAVGAVLQARGHAIAWVGYQSILEGRLPDGARGYPLQSAQSPEWIADLVARIRSVRGLRNLKLTWGELFVPMARDMARGVDQAVEDFRPDVLVVDQQALAGALIARRRGLRWATSATSPADRVRSLAALPKVLAWTDELIVALQRDFGLDPVGVPEDSPELVLLFSTPELAGPLEDFPPQYRLVGPAIERRRETVDFPWDALESGPRVLLTLGSLNAERGRRVFELAKEALGGLPIQVIAVAPEGLGPYPPNFIARSWVPQLELLAEIDAVVCHGGNNTVSEALAFGLPLVVIPITDDQPVLAQRVSAAGCGVRLSYPRLRAEGLRDAVTRVLSEAGFREAARRIRESIAQAGGAERAADLLEELAEEDGK
ncbi:MAG: glycosyltransferase [Chromatiales bacterium]|jgi:MGT family glycosyltransferase